MLLLLYSLKYLFIIFLHYIFSLFVLISVQIIFLIFVQYYNYHVLSHNPSDLQQVAAELCINEHQFIIYSFQYSSFLFCLIVIIITMIILFIIIAYWINLALEHINHHLQQDIRNCLSFMNETSSLNFL